MTISPTYADLGGGLASAAQPGTTQPRDVRHTDTILTGRPPGVCTEHMFDPVSGWCSCGIRDDGKLAEGSPAWRAEIDRQMPNGEGTA